MPSERLPQSVITGGVAFALSIAALYFGRDLLMPVAMATLLSFLLSPAVSRLERAHLPRRRSGEDLALRRLERVEATLLREHALVERRSRLGRRRKSSRRV